MTACPLILLVDDHEALCLAQARLFERAGLSCVTALSAKDALGLLQGTCPDAIIVALNMPVTDGIGLLRAIRRHSKHRRTPVGVFSCDLFVGLGTRTAVANLGALFASDIVREDGLLHFARQVLGLGNA